MSKNKKLKLRDGRLQTVEFYVALATHYECVHNTEALPNDGRSCVVTLEFNNFVAAQNWSHS